MCVGFNLLYIGIAIFLSFMGVALSIVMIGIITDELDNE